MARVFDAPIISNDQSLDRLLAVDLPVLILFWSGQDYPEAINQAMVTLASSQAGELILAKINAHDSPHAARRFNVRQTPVLVGTKGGGEVTRAEHPRLEDLEAHAHFLLGQAARPANTTNPAQSEQASGNVNRAAESRPMPVRDATFEQMVLQASVPVLVDFWAPWCGPCHAVAPVLDRLARDFAGRLRVAKVNVDENPHYAGLYGVQGIPTLLFVRNGQVVERLVGAMPENYLRAKVEQLLRSN